MAEFDIGPIGNMEGRVIGLHAAGNLVGDLGSIGTSRLIAQRRARRMAGKDFNDQPTSQTVGSEDNQAIRDPGEPPDDTSWMPAM